MFGRKKKPDSTWGLSQKTIYREWIEIYLQHWSKDPWFNGPVTCMHCFCLVESKYQARHLETHGVYGSEKWYKEAEAKFSDNDLKEPEQDSADYQKKEKK